MMQPDSTVPRIGRTLTIDDIPFGRLTYAGIELLAGRPREVSPAVAVPAALFVIKFAFL